ncbi:MAG: protein archease [Candidatus Woesearchaeota archaeon]|nr:protein archease [Candidatus Woesearchaeota archaeon]MDN5327878.1 protein archease [Candidatus Woesearchaeota archaeon]
MKKFEYLDDLPSDAGFIAYGTTLNELFENSALALFSLIAKVEELKGNNEVSITLKDKTIESLLYSFLSTLIAESEINEMFFSKVKVNINEDKNNKDLKYKLEAKVFGEPYQENKGLNLVKAITLHNLSINKKNNIYSATVFVDL